MANSEASGVSSKVEQPSIILRAVWFLLVGWWATGIWLGVAWFLNVTIIGIPLGIKMINKVPFVVSLKRPGDTLVADSERIRRAPKEQRGLLVRGVWFLLVGWWLSGIWMAIAYVFTLSIIGLPIAIWMYGKLPFVVSLYRY